MRPICVGCQLPMRCIKNDQVVRDAAIGQFPSTYFRGDLFECPDCKHQVVVGLGRPIGPQQAQEQRLATGEFIEFYQHPQQKEQYGDSTLPQRAQH